MEIRPITKNNYSEVADIYGEGIATGVATFETSIPNWYKWNSSHLDFARIAAYESDKILGWASLSPVSDRCVYGGVAEVSVYVSADARGKGVGVFLMEQLVKLSEENNIWTLQSGIFRKNKASIELHKKCGFRIIGYRERIGLLHGEWLDNVLLERRSKKIGI